jgi:hypothetical protein
LRILLRCVVLWVRLSLTCARRRFSIAAARCDGATMVLLTLTL